MIFNVREISILCHSPSFLFIFNMKLNDILRKYQKEKKIDNDFWYFFAKLFFIPPLSIFNMKLNDILIVNIKKKIDSDFWYFFAKLFSPLLPSIFNMKLNEIILIVNIKKKSIMIFSVREISPFLLPLFLFLIWN